MHNTNLNLFHQLTLDQPNDDLLTIDRTPTPLGQVQRLMSLATNEQHKTAHYGLMRLAAELQRQDQIMVKKGEVTHEKNLKLQSLTLECRNKLQFIHIQLNDRLIEILLRQLERNDKMDDAIGGWPLLVRLYKTAKPHLIEIWKSWQLGQSDARTPDDIQSAGIEARDEIDQILTAYRQQIDDILQTEGISPETPPEVVILPTRKHRLKENAHVRK